MSALSPAKPELLAPAGDWECARAAAANGADAIYFGLERFNARLRAQNFTETDLPALMEFLHARGMRGYVTLNTLVFPAELPAAGEMLALLQRCRVDAAIIQDLGVARLAREVAPDVEIHASTQMSLTSPEGLRFARKLGVTRAVLARELSLRELAKFRSAADAEELPETEVFVHGALCVAYSGQCLTSEALGQRSANRGECAQACRLPYEMLVDGVLRPLGDRRYLLSPQDLAAVREIPELTRLGVSCFKIEGRLKAPEYVAAVCQAYRRAIDEAWRAWEADGFTPAPRPPHEPTAAETMALEMTFSRGLFPGWMHGVNHQELVHGRFGKKRGPLAGVVVRSGSDHVELRDAPLVPLLPGDGVVFEVSGGDTDKEQGGRLYELRADGRRLFFERGKIDFGAIPPGARVWKTSDPRLDARLRASFAKDPPPRRRSVAVRATGCASAPLRLECEGIVAESELPLAAAVSRPLTAETLRAQLDRLGGTAYALGSLDFALEGELILPPSEINRLRRALVAALDGRARPAAVVAAPHPRAALEGLLPSHGTYTTHGTASDPQLAVLCRTLSQLEAALAAGVQILYADFEDIRRGKDAVALVRAFSPPERGPLPSSIFHPLGSPPRLLLATPRIQKAGEQGFFKVIENACPDGVLVRNVGALDYFAGSGLELVGDFSLNVANALAASLLRDAGLTRLCVSYDLNAEQVLDLLRSAPPEWFELTLHQHLPMFHMEHCVFAAFLSKGKDHTDCGRPCDHHRVALRDRVGMAHPVLADVGCRNTVYHGRAQSGARFAGEFRAAGARHFRVELLNEDAAQTAQVIAGYRDLLAGRADGPALARRLRAADQLGVTSGTLTVLG